MSSYLLSCFGVIWGENWKKKNSVGSKKYFSCQIEPHTSKLSYSGVFNIFGENSHNNMSL